MEQDLQTEIKKLKERVELLENVIADLSYSDRFIFKKHIQFLGGRNIQFDTTNGTKIGTATTQKVGFYNATPVVQPSGASQVILSLSGTYAFDYSAIQTLVNKLRNDLVTLGFIKGSA